MEQLTPKEKAVELYHKIFTNWHTNKDHDSIIASAIIHLNGLIDYCKTWGDIALDDIKEFEEIITELEKM